ncbi:uncharacterized protein LOC141691938 [Apium graveolens]|uniref:uncharacterized protein LOC141691938 n=1 Tax=Apium graveolens TaxID=4045 RepID=UPI003D7B1A1E
MKTTGSSAASNSETVVPNNYDKIKNKLCDKAFSGGIYRLKQHIAGLRGNVKPCPKSTPLDKSKCLQALEGSKKRRQDKKEHIEEVRDEVAISKDSDDVVEIDNADDAFHRFYEAVGQNGPGYIPPSQHQLREPLLKKEVERTKQSLKEQDDEWKKFGCSIMTDAWSDRKRRSIMNLCVNCKLGTSFLSSIECSNEAHTAKFIFEYVDKYIQKVGPGNIIQVVTDNASNNMAATKLLREKRPHIFWTSCAKHTLNRMLEAIDFCRVLSNILCCFSVVSTEFYIPVLCHVFCTGFFMQFLFNNLQNRLSRISAEFSTDFLQNLCCFYPFSAEFMQFLQIFFCRKTPKFKFVIEKAKALTIFIYAHHKTLALMRNILEKKEKLKFMFLSEEWGHCKFSTSAKGVASYATIVNQSFWTNHAMCFELFKPLVKILRLVDGDWRPSMGFVYGELKDAKKEIIKLYKDTKEIYEPIIQIIDSRAKDRLDSPLHLAGYLLNPYYYYRDDEAQKDSTCMTAILTCIEAFFLDKFHV